MCCLAVQKCAGKYVVARRQTAVVPNSNVDTSSTTEELVNVWIGGNKPSNPKKMPWHTETIPRSRSVLPAAHLLCDCRLSMPLRRRLVLVAGNRCLVCCACPA